MLLKLIFLRKYFKNNEMRQFVTSIEVGTQFEKRETPFKKLKIT